MKWKVSTDTLLITGASVLLVGLALTQGLVSYYAQQGFIYDVKHDITASNLEALGLDAGSVIFALLALALARIGRKALAPRFLNLACAVGSLLMNVLSADRGDPKAVAVYALPSLLYIAASDQLIGTIRLRALAGRESVEKTSPLKVLKTMSLWALRLPLAPRSTFLTLRKRVLDATSLEVPAVTADELAQTDDTYDEPDPLLDEIDILEDLSTNAAKVRMAVEALGVSANPQDIYSWLISRGQDVPMHSINSTLSRDRRAKEETSTSEGLADAAIAAEPKASVATPPGQRRLTRV
jgi:hypothetical protein